MSKIEWTQKCWNCVTGCSKVSQGCKYCYAEVMAKRLQAMGQPRYANGFQVTLHPQTLALPLQWARPQRIFVNSMSDLYHEQVPLDYILQVFDIMHHAPQHQYQILTKRTKRLAEELDAVLPWTPSICQGVSVERNDVIWRIDDLRSTHASIKFLSFEPLLGPLPHLDLSGIHWAIIGGESGPKARPMQTAWVREIIEQCRAQGVAVFVKQMGSVWARAHGYSDKGGDWNVWDERDLCIREYPVTQHVGGQHD